MDPSLAGGSAVAELHQPGVKPPGAPKRVSAGDREWLLGRMRAGDVVLSRHDDAVSNLFLPGFWPHASLFLGNGDERRGLAVPVAAPVARRISAAPTFLEAKKDGVKFRHPDETLAVDSVPGEYDCAVGEAPCLTPDDDRGYLIDEAQVTYRGICPACQARNQSSAGSTAKDDDGPSSQRAG